MIEEESTHEPFANISRSIVCFLLFSRMGKRTASTTIVLVHWMKTV
jgi:hypothetical protein